MKKMILMLVLMVTGCSGGGSVTSNNSQKTTTTTGAGIASSAVSSSSKSSSSVSSSSSKSSSSMSSSLSSTSAVSGSLDVYFQDDFEGSTLAGTSTKYPSNWSLKNHDSISSLGFNNVGGLDYAFQKFVLDPTETGRTVLYAQTLNDDPAVSGTTRAQMSIGFKTTLDLSVYHTSHRMYLHPDMQELAQYSEKITWLTLFEIWTFRNEAWDGDIAGSARWTFSLNKDVGIGKPLYWTIESEYMQPANIKFHDIWPKVKNTQVDIPFGKWFTLDYYLKRGQGSEGHIVIAITVDGEQKIELFNIKNHTIYPDHPELILKAWQPFKLYTSDTILDWLSARGKKLAAYYNDFKWFKQ